MAKSSGVDVRWSRTKPEWLVASFGAGFVGGFILVVAGFVLSSVLHGVGGMGFHLGSVGMRSVYMVGAAVFAVVSAIGLASMRPRVVSGGSGAGVGRPAGRARVWPGLAAVDVGGVNGSADEAVTDVRPV